MKRYLNEIILTDATTVNTLVPEDALVGMTLSDGSQFVVPHLQPDQNPRLRCSLWNVAVQIYRYFM